jgi:hypothetical protein
MTLSSERSSSSDWKGPIVVAGGVSAPLDNDEANDRASTTRWWSVFRFERVLQVSVYAFAWRWVLSMRIYAFHGSQKHKTANGLLQQLACLGLKEYTYTYICVYTRYLHVHVHTMTYTTTYKCHLVFTLPQDVVALVAQVSTLTIRHRCRPCSQYSSHEPTCTGESLNTSVLISWPSVCMPTPSMTSHMPSACALLGSMSNSGVRMATRGS